MICERHAVLLLLLCHRLLLYFADVYLLRLTILGALTCNATCPICAVVVFQRFRQFVGSWCTLMTGTL